MKYKCIYNPRLAGFLMFNGIHLMRIERNLDRPWTNVYLFENKETEITALIDKFKEIKETDNDIDRNSKSKERNTRNKEVSRNGLCS